MPEANDMELLREFAQTGAETAFAGLVQRHINLVYSVALRHVGIAAHAEEITQAVFIILARKAARLRPNIILEGWLHATTRLTALHFLRGERRRQFREQEAYMQSTLHATGDTGHDATWEQLAPLLDDAISRLGPKDRDAVMLRFFKNQNIREVAAALEVNEAAAQRRILRALEKLRKFFTKRGVSSTPAILAGMISVNSVQAAPVGLAKAATAVAVAKGAVASVSTLTLIKGALKIMAWIKAKTTIVAGVGVLLVAATTVVIVEKFKPSEPIYQGRSLSAWLKDYDNIEETFANNGAKLHELDKIVNQAGTNGVSVLLRLLREEDFKKHGIHSNGNEASNGFRVLGASATNAVPDLIKIYEHNQAARVDVLYSLGCIGTNADVPVDWLLPKLKDPDHQIRAGIAYVLGNMHTKSEQAIPALMKCLSDSNRMVRGDSALALGSCGIDAMPAIPKLIDMLHEKDKAVRNSAALALKEIDPEAAAKVGVK